MFLDFIIKTASGLIKEKPNEEEDSPWQDEVIMPELIPEEEKALKTMEQNLNRAIDGMLVLNSAPITFLPSLKNLKARKKV